MMQCLHDVMEWGGYAGQKDDSSSGWDRAKLKICELFISGISHLVYLDHVRLWVTETMESNALDRGELLYN